VLGIFLLKYVFDIKCIPQSRRDACKFFWERVLRDDLSLPAPLPCCLDSSCIDIFVARLLLRVIVEAIKNQSPE